MLPLSRVRELVPDAERLTDDQLESLRAQFYDLARNIVDAAARRRSRDDSRPTEPGHLRGEELPNEEMQEAFDDRPGILEFDGGQSRRGAERAIALASRPPHDGA